MTSSMTNVKPEIFLSWQKVIFKKISMFQKDKKFFIKEFSKKKSKKVQKN